MTKHERLIALVEAFVRRVERIYSGDEDEIQRGLLLASTVLINWIEERRKPDFPR